MQRQRHRSCLEGDGAVTGGEEELGIILENPCHYRAERKGEDIRNTKGAEWGKEKPGEKNHRT